MNKTILIVEDDDNDRLFQSLAFEHIRFREHIQFAADGAQAIDYLRGMHRFANRQKFPLPQLILLDLNLPLIPGLQVLSWIRCRERFNSTIVIPLTSSASPIDVEAAHLAGANDYLVKPVGIQGWRDQAAQIVSTWLSSAAGHPQPEWGALQHVAA